LSVPGAVADLQRLARLISEKPGLFKDIFVSLDTHAKLHIAHASFWEDAAGAHPAPMTTITARDVSAGKWKPVIAEFAHLASEYVQALEKKQRFKLLIWPDHCLVGSEGHAVFRPLLDALHVWEDAARRPVNFLEKGQNSLTEMYSIFKAEVPLAQDPSTQLNKRFIAQLARFSRIMVAGEASSHCVQYSVLDLAANYPANRRAEICVLQDCMSPVTGFKQAEAEFLQTCRTLGVTLADSSSM
jgi:nicotinamidase/pyrazinamidase